MNLKRFRNVGIGTRKLDCMVTFPETFDFSKTVSEAFSPDFVQVLLVPINYPYITSSVIYRHVLFFQSDCRYTLYAVVVHSGGVMCGHYTAYVRHRGTQRWYYADDSHVKQVLPGTFFLKSSEALLLNSGCSRGSSALLRLVFDLNFNTQVSWEEVKTSYGGHYR